MNCFPRLPCLILLAALLAAVKAGAEDVCAVCQKPITGPIYLATDEVTGENEEVCSNCLRLPHCFICGLPVGNDGVDLSDGRHLCARDGKTAVIDADDARRVAEGVREKMDRLFSRFMSFPTNVDVDCLDRIDVDKLFQPGGYDFESPNLLGCIRVETNGAQKQYSMRLLTGLPVVRLEATAAHEFTHAWVGDNVPPTRRAQLAGDAEEGFCELLAYLLMDSEHEEAQRKFILKNHYTRGQIDLFIEAQTQYGLNDVLDWIQYGETPKLREGHLDEIRNVKIPQSVTSPIDPSVEFRFKPAATNAPLPVARAEPETIRLQGILWRSPPSAIVNDHTLLVGDELRLKIGKTDVVIRCLKIKKNSVQIQEMGSGKIEELDF